MELNSPKILLMVVALLGAFCCGSADLMKDFGDSVCKYLNPASGTGIWTYEQIRRPRDVAFFGAGMFAGLGVPNFWTAAAIIKFVFFQPCGVRQVTVKDAKSLLNNPHFNVNRKTIIFTSGWLSRKVDDAPNLMADAYLCRGDYNYLYVNTVGYLHRDYVSSALRTMELGEAVAIGLHKLGIQGDKIHIVGHSLGSHIAGNAGRYFYQLTGQKIGRITGLDPARPCFTKPVIFPSLRRGDATFVDIIHSNPYKLGTEDAIGDADFYASDLDILQPGCDSDVCSHSRSIEYFTETVYSKNGYNFMARRCEKFSDLEHKSCRGPKSPVGFAADKNSKGIYSFAVHKQSPYGLDAKSGSLSKCTKCNKARWSWYDKIYMYY